MSRIFLSPVVIGWQVGVPSGWGTYGLNLAFQLASKGVEVGLPFLAQTLNATKEQDVVLKSALEQHPHFAGLIAQDARHVLTSPFLRALGDGLDFPPFLDSWSGKPDIGVVFFESVQFPSANLKRAKALDAVITGSNWNTEVLRRAGLDNVFNCPQGIDPEIFCPGARSQRFGDRFTIFSGGKLEYRKGQDLVVAAFKRFHQKHPDSLLVTAWHNPWPKAARSISASPHVETMPGVSKSGKLDVSNWLRAEGLVLGSFVDLGLLSNAEMPALLRDVDLAIFPNRCEGGTNLVAMEAMACGIPVVLSRNTGHLDLFGKDTCYSLDLQIPLGEITGRNDLEGWGESSIEELIQKMELAYSQEDRRRQIARNGAAFIADWSWSTQVDRLIDAIVQVS